MPIDIDDTFRRIYRFSITAITSFFSDFLPIKIGLDNSYDNRKKIAKKNGISNYSGTVSQNEKLLSLLKQAKLKKA